MRQLRLSSRVDLDARRRLRLVNSVNAAKVLGHDRFWTGPFLLGYLECCEERHRYQCGSGL